MKKTFNRAKLPGKHMMTGLMSGLLIILILSCILKVDLIRSIFIGMTACFYILVPLIFNRLIKYRITDDNRVTGKGINIDIATIDTIISTNRHKVFVVNKPKNGDKCIRNIFFIEDMDGFIKALTSINRGIKVEIE